MSVNLSIKNVSDEVVQLLRERAARNRRSLQKELLVIVEEVVRQDAPLTIDDLVAGARARGLTVADESTPVIRTLRDGRSGGS